MRSGHPPHSLVGSVKWELLRADPLHHVHHGVYVDGLAAELTGLPGVAPLRIGSCERSWSFEPFDDEAIGFGSLRIETNDEPIVDCHMRVAPSGCYHW